METMLQTLIVSPGEYLITSDPSAILETHLGSCVGIALHDPVAGLGGLLHFILPDANDRRAKAAPAKYARTGIPLLIQEMEMSGGKKKRFKGWMAGGAEMLSGRIRSAGLNIGRRNIQAASEILRAEEIPVVCKETGGNFGWTLRLWIGKGRAESYSIARTGKDFKKEADSTFNLDKAELLRSIQNLAPLSQVAVKLFTRIEEEADSIAFAELTEEIYKDQSLTANILRLCNSAYFGLPRQIIALSQALVLLGMNNLRRIILLALMKSIYGQKPNPYFLRKGDLFRHALACALTAERLAREKGYPDPESAFVAGLLHDIGKVVLGQYAPGRFSQLINMVTREGKPFDQAEKEVFGYNHAQVGSWMAEDWQLPSLLQEAILFHHDPLAAAGNPMLVSLVHIADAVCNMLGLGGGRGGLANPVVPAALSLIRLQVKEVEDTISVLPEIIRRAGEAF